MENTKNATEGDVDSKDSRRKKPKVTIALRNKGRVPIENTISSRGDKENISKDSGSNCAGDAKKTINRKQPKRHSNTSDSSPLAKHKRSEIIEKTSGVRTRSQSNVTAAENNASNDETKTASDDEDLSDNFFSCKICKKSFNNYNKYKKHKVTCMKISKKHQCSKCAKGFTQQHLLNQHFDYRHTDKSKHFVCEPCGKSFELKKTLQEHNLQLHNDKDKKYLCDFCSRFFWHFGEFTLHRASHTGIKPFKCGRCGKASFACSEQLTKYLKRCGISGNVKCNKCGKCFSEDLGLAKHIKDIHEQNTKWRCPFCELIYNSEGGYFQHLRIKHGIGRKGKKFSDALLEKLAEQNKANTTDESKSESGNDGSTAVNNSSQKEESKKEEENPNTSKSENSDKKEMSHKCPFPKCQESELANESDYYQHLRDEHKLGRNK